MKSRESILVILHLRLRRACILPLNLLFLKMPSREFGASYFKQELMRFRIFTGDVVEGAVWLVTGTLLTS